MTIEVVAYFDVGGFSTVKLRFPDVQAAKTFMQMNGATLQDLGWDQIMLPEGVNWTLRRST